ncbi:ribosome biogenesis GTPase [Aliiruegeria haliotis]|uniref:Small ribosomal subunit biogenesis GTPase RsgA n=1 Tax=Aliiruegeria haliotis TaxID=1280846 RepID=A0A2T0RTP2_9RHOB|nr:ribosome small subunit-dependent GTPase A [Aliiruegeria haliotis]PRY24507.1 ribosome biogenesis GTPase [Aliiruegeria haliotis]
MTSITLSDLGWSAHFRAQLDDAPEDLARISGVERTRLEALSPDGPVSLSLPGGQSTGDYAVGDWVRYDPETGRCLRRFERQTLLHRRAAGTGAVDQLIAANVDTLGIVTSCNADFKEARLERYLALAAQAGCLPLVIITKADTVDDPGAYRRRAESLSPLVVAIDIDATDPLEIRRLNAWAADGRTLALLGSSGVGKTTISNALTGRGEATQGIREDDAKGRHTTTSRALWRTTAGGWLIDTPGMRALRLTDAAEGIDTVFADLTDLAGQCRFSDCTHGNEPGCAIQAEIDAGRLDPGRLRRWEKLLREDARNSETLAEARARDRSLQKVYRQGQAIGKQKRGL